jgi:hypothetical protein
MPDSTQPGSNGGDLIAPIAIPEVVIPAVNKHLRFSFRHLDLQHPKFPISNCCARYLSALMATMQEYSNWLVEDFCDQENNDHRHIIWFPDTSEPQGFASVDEEQLGYSDAWQFQLSQTEHWRVHGILIDDTFYAIWLDPFHRLYPLSDCLRIETAPLQR